MLRWTRLRPTSARALLALLLALALGLPVPRAQAAPSARQASRAAFSQAQADYAAGRYAEALTGYSEAHRLLPMPAFLFNMAQCHRLLGRTREALALYRQYLEEAPRAKNRALVEGFVATLEAEQAAAAQAPRAPAPEQRPPAQLTPDTVPQQEAHAALQPAPEAATVAPPLYRQWWFWTGVGVVVGGLAAGVALSSSPPAAEAPTLGEVSLR